MSELINVNFPLLNKSIQVDKDSTISNACALIGEPLNLVCGGKGKCGKCKVDVKINGKVESVLGCVTKMCENLDILITSQGSSAQILTNNMLKDIIANPSLKFYFLNKTKLKTSIGESDWETLCSQLQIDFEKPTLELLQKISNLFHHSNGINLVAYDNTVIDVLPGDENMSLYGFAFDIGSTSIVGYLYNLVTHEKLAISSQLNKQTSIAGDVIGRIEYAINEPTGLKKLHNLVIETVNEIINDLCYKSKIEKNSIYQANFCGNSTMQHLFFNINPQYLGLAPFSSTTHDMIFAKAKELNIKINPNGAITFFPLLGGHVGGDTAAVLLSLPQDGKNRLIIDLGTNGEVAVGRNTHYKVASMASGPALEGYGIEYGMRGTVGAIERVSIYNGDVIYKVIGQVKPIGICGSGIIDIIAELLRNDLINKRGAFVDPDKIKEINLARRIINTDDKKAFIIAHREETESGEPIVLTQDDIRQVQLAKGAIFTGCTMLIEEAGLKGKDLEEILMAGAFGNYINIDMAQLMGMIPYFEGVPVYSIGNAAATGSQLFLLSQEEKEKCLEIARNALHIEIATNPNFTKNYMKNTYLNTLEVYKH